ncbi:MAG: FAD-binding oxidoreductase [Chloroflexia bacterium]|nr:FAD-binding oxidoreductase [Chloroflexia bacterium]
MQEPWRFGGFDLGVNKNRVNGLIKSIHNYFPAYNPEDFNGINAWSGLRPVSFDGLPFIGRFKKYPNLIAATGHSMMGISLAPITGKIVEEIIAKRKIDYNMDLLSPGRN